MTIIDEMNLQQREFYSNLNALNQYIKAEDVTNREMSWRGQVMPGREFCRRLRFTSSSSTARSSSTTSSVLQNVSPDMRGSSRICGDVIQECEVFRNASDDLVTAIAVGMDIQVFARGDRVYDVGQPRILCTGPSRP